MCKSRNYFNTKRIKFFAFIKINIEDGKITHKYPKIVHN